MDKICVIGLGYVGLPLAHAFASKYPVIGFDIKEKRIIQLRQGLDHTLEVNEKDLKEVLSHSNNTDHRGLVLTYQTEDISDCNIFIVTVPTPIDRYKKPNLEPLLKASEIVGRVLKKNNIVIYESTVYPGVTEDECVPILEKFSGLRFNQDFFCGYSPERINPGDKKHRVTNIVKVTSGSTPEIAKKVDELYRSVITAGTYLASSIKVAEAAKVIENSQRDINIAFVNELCMIFDYLGIDTQEVLKAANTKWNFLDFKPGLVGGHCIGVDPYYLTHKAQEIGYHPEIILAGRRINDNMGVYIAQRVIKLMSKAGYPIKGSKVLVLGITFKENCSDTRNSKVIDLIRELQDFGCDVEVADYWADVDDVVQEYGLELQKNVVTDAYRTIVLAVAHDEYRKLKFNKQKQIVFDVKGVLEDIDGRL